MSLLVLALALLFASAALALFAFRRPALSTALGALGAVAACGVGLVPAIRALLSGQAAQLTLPWQAPLGDLKLGIDPLSAFFLVPLLVLSGVAAVYGREYLLAYRDRKSLGPPAFAFNVLVAAMIVVVVARDAVLFLVAWEVMTLASYALVTFDHQQEEVRRAGWVYLVAAHVGVACLLAMFLLLGTRAGGFGFAELQAMPPAAGGWGALVFVLAAVGFGVKAGFVPVHVWLPEAHAAAPSHVSALMSGVLIKLGLYGLLRVLTLLQPASWWGPTLIVVGFVGAVLGISLALKQRDLKRVLAYSSVENVGLITLALGIGYWGLGQGDLRVAALGACGALLHVWSHVLMKGLMFLSAGSVLHGAGTKDLERLGGLMKRMPRTSVAMLLGAVAIAGLPPMNGFAGEWLMYLGLIRGGLAHEDASGIAAILGVGLLALVGGLAALCFVRLVGVALLGEARSDAARKAHESSWWMVGPLWLLVLATLGVAIFPGQILGVLTGVVGQLFGPGILEQVAVVRGSLDGLGKVNAVLFGVLAVAGAVWARASRPQVEAVETWGCGYAAPTSRMQYTARSFSQLMVDSLLPSFLHPIIEKRSPDALFPANGSFGTRSADPLTSRIYEPVFSRLANRFAQLRWLQQGNLNVYLLYILVVLMLALAWMSWRGWMSA